MNKPIVIANHNWLVYKNDIVEHRFFGSYIYDTSYPFNTIFCVWVVLLLSMPQFEVQTIDHCNLTIISLRLCFIMFRDKSSKIINSCESVIDINVLINFKYNVTWNKHIKIYSLNQHFTSTYSLSTRTYMFNGIIGNKSSIWSSHFNAINANKSSIVNSHNNLIGYWISLRSQLITFKRVILEYEFVKCIHLLRNLYNATYIDI